MLVTDENIELSVLHDANNFQISDLDSEIKVDRLCSALLKKFHQYLLNEKQLEALEAGALAAGADYFLREFMIGKKRANIFSASGENIRQFAGNWYIISNLEPNMEELSVMLQGAAHFFNYCDSHKLIKSGIATEIANTCEMTDYFQQRIDDFHAISGDGYTKWDQDCPLD
jgi:hypothetical protein